MPSPPASVDKSSPFVTLSRADLDLLLEQAAARGAAQVLTLQQTEYLDMAQAAAHLYGRPDRVYAFRTLRLRYPQLDEVSIGSGRFRRWKRVDLDAFLAQKPLFQRRRTQKSATVTDSQRAAP